MLAGAVQVLLEEIAPATEAAGVADAMIEAFRGVPGPLVSLCSEARRGAAFLSYFGATRIQNAFSQIRAGTFCDALVVRTDAVEFLLFQLC